MPVDVDAAYRRFGPMVRRRCQQLLKDPDHARDAMQDTFIKLLRNEPKLDDRALGGLLYRMATQVSLNRIRSQRRHPEDPHEDLLARIAAAHDPEESLSARTLLDKLFAREPQSSRTIAVLHLVDGMTLEQVAEHVGLSVSGVRYRLRGLRSQLHELENVA